jgi:Ca2+-binding RTX toxin-like protein
MTSYPASQAATTCLGAGGNDRVVGGDNGTRENQMLFGGSEDDQVLGTNGPDVLNGGPGDDFCDGDNGTDIARPSCEEVVNVP